MGIFWSDLRLNTSIDLQYFAVDLPLAKSHMVEEDLEYFKILQEELPKLGEVPEGNSGHTPD